MDKNVISVIIPIFNCGKYLEKSVPALLNQTWRDLELILVDDGSADNSLALCREFERRDNRVKVLHKEKSGGAGPARNDGMRAARGEFLMFIDADDWIEPNMLEKLHAALEESGSDIAVCGYESFVEGAPNNKAAVSFEKAVYDTPEKTRKLFTEFFPEGFVGYLWNKLYRASFIRENNVDFPPMRRLQDGVFNVRAFGCAQSCCVIPDVLYHYRLNAQKDLFRKCPPDYYDLIRAFSKAYLEEKKKWGAASDVKINSFFLNELGTCLENTYSPQWNMNGKARSAYFSRIAADPFFKTVCAGEYQIGRYRRILIALLEKRRYFLLRAVMRFKLFGKIACKRIFYIVKKV